MGLDRNSKGGVLRNKLFILACIVLLPCFVIAFLNKRYGDGELWISFCEYVVVLGFVPKK